MALTYTPAPEIGTPCPEFSLPAVDGKTWSLKDVQLAHPQALVVMFICNHCPYVKAIEDRLIDLGLEMRARNVQILAISANDALHYPEDSFENLKKRWSEKNYPFPYLYDATQTVAKSFGAVCTPDFFVYDEHSRLAYRGRLDDSWKDASQVKRRELKDAITAVLEGRQVSSEQRPSMGCNIKWKK